MQKPRIIVAGGGAAGLLAAGRAAELGADVTLLEKMPHAGRKLRITGKGRCNLTNVAPRVEFIQHFGRGGKFLHSAFARFFSAELMAFLEKLGVPVVTERGGRVFPASGKAPDVVQALLHWVKQSGVRIVTQAPVERLQIEDAHIVGVVAKGSVWPCDALILATGGASYPLTGSTGDGYRLAREVGHTLVPIRPALVPLETAGDAATRMAGLALKNVGVKLLIDGKKRGEGFGEMSFTETGVTGPIILTLSGTAVDALRAGESVALAIDLKPALDEQKLDARLRHDFAEQGREPLQKILRGLLPQAMIPVCLMQTNLPAARTGNQITAEERLTLRRWLKNFLLTVTGHRPMDEAIITAGGINTREVDPRSMQSLKLPGLFLAGEMLDIQADTGGYNLQAAFSTGWLAGTAAAEMPSATMPTE
jgi:predicted Rossmann fold flavoprotein